MQRRCDRNRKRSKRRGIYCPIHGCYLDSVSQKYQIFADKPGQLQQRGMSRRNALILVANRTAVPLEGEWLEAFWCEHCQQTRWYHVRKRDERTYEISTAPQELWQQATGVISSHGNPSVSEFTRRSAKDITYQTLSSFQVVN
ncbi:hypothetical protein ACX27_18260 [Nostoc piscinale CENA21]|uniref:Uncharacterized protein n=1 Tax=Nostoc piscinale CENA21 TaxID=224013 RepID=A0A0M4T717_9NOSO|nr:hypothetical protein [Nostoc piscinale]ALF56445.1 hypothetical protein ACX27_18260 [Nostoc piscinale CENA21]